MSKTTYGLQRGGKAQIGGLVVPVMPGVQGLGVTLDGLTLDGRSWRTLIGDAVTGEPMLERTVEGASTLSIEVHDPHGKLLAHPLLNESYDVDLDGLGFRKVKVSRQDSTTLGLTFEDREVAILRGKKGARKANPDKVTLPQFCFQLVREVKPPIPFYSPELSAPPKPLTSAKGARAAQSQQQATRQPGGLTRASHVTVKGKAASTAQLNVIERVLDTARSMHAPTKALIACIMCITQENSASTGGDGPFQQNPSWPGDPNDVENATRNFLSRAPTYPGGLLRYLQRNPHTALGPAIQEIQKSLFPGAYAQWEHEASRTVDAYLRTTGDSPTTSGARGTDPGTRSQQQLKRNKTENTWDCMGRLTDDVGWRRFVSAGIVYVLAEPDLLGSAPRIEVSDSMPGLVDRPTFDEDDNKVVNEMTLTVRAHTWQAPPGTVAMCADELGPAKGAFIVTTIRAPIPRHGRPVNAEITLTRPQEPHAPSGSAGGSGKSKTKLRSDGGSSKGSGEAEQFVTWCKSQLGVTEGSSRQRQYAAALGLSAGLPWCSIFVAYGLKQTTHLPMPGNPAYSGAWLDWRGGSKVNKGNLQPGDLIVYDWGDGGQTDHVAVYVGHGQRIGGNQSNRVSQEAAMLSASVGCVRPHWSG